MLQSTRRRRQLLDVHQVEFISLSAWPAPCISCPLNNAHGAHPCCVFRLFTPLFCSVDGNASPLFSGTLLTYAVPSVASFRGQAVTSGATRGGEVVVIGGGFTSNHVLPALRVCAASCGHFVRSRVGVHGP